MIYTKKIMLNNTLYIVSLPIGNDDDITYRAINILKNVQTIYCEDTRKFKKYLYKYDIKCKIDSYYDQIEKIKSAKIIQDLKTKTNYQIALVSDGGTPMISDPGYHLINACRLNNIKVIPIPGVSSVICGLSVCPFNSSDFRFIGFFTKEKINIIKETNCTIVFFESPKRIKNTLELLKQFIIKRKIFISREMTKTHESYYSFYLDSIPFIEELGEFTVIIEPTNLEEEFNNLNFKNLKNYYNQTLTPTLMSNLISDLLKNKKKNQIYKKIIENLKSD